MLPVLEKQALIVDPFQVWSFSRDRINSFAFHRSFLLAKLLIISRDVLFEDFMRI